MKQFARAFTAALAFVALSSAQTSAAMTDPDKLTRELYDTRLGLVSMLIDSATKGKTHLQLKSAISADPGGGTTQQIYPYITVFQCTQPARVKLEGVGECTLLGAARIMESASAPGEKETVPAGVYLLASPPPIEERFASYRVSLISVAITDEGKLTAKEVLSVPAKFQRVFTWSGILPAASARFPHKSNETAGQVDITMAWEQAKYDFSLHLDIIFI